MRENKSYNGAAYWLKKPITMMKAIVGWRLEEEAPWWSIFGVMFDFTFINFLLFNLVRIIRMIRAHSLLAFSITGELYALVATFIISVGVIAWAMILLKILKVILRK